MSTPKPMGFVEFVSKVGRVKLTPAQRVLALVAFDGVEPRDLEGDDRELARRLFGDVETIPPEARAVLVAVCGARAGKSYVLGGLYSIWRGLTADLSTLAPGEVAVALIVAPDLRLARQVLRYALGVAEFVPAIKRHIKSRTADGFTLARPDGGTVSVECLPATRGGSAVRGRSLVSAVLDESAFFRDESYSVNDVEIYRAAAPRVLRGGMVVIASTPWAEGGLLHDFHKRNHGHPADAISAHAPTLLLRDDEHTRAYVAREQARDPQNAAREFGAEFMSAGSEAFFDPRAIEAAVDESLTLPLPSRYGVSVGVGADFAFRSDSSALAVVFGDSVEQGPDKSYTVADLRELCPEAKRPLVPSEVVATFADVANGYHAEHVVADGHYRMAIWEHLRTHALGFLSAPEGAKGKAESYQLVRALLHEGRIRLPNHPRLLRQMKEVVARPTAGGGVTIVSPRWRTGGHGDLVSSLVLAVYDASRRVPVEAPRPEPGSDEWAKQEAEREKEQTMRAVRERLRREWKRNPRAAIQRMAER